MPKYDILVTLSSASPAPPRRQSVSRAAPWKGGRWPPLAASQTHAPWKRLTAISLSSPRVYLLYLPFLLLFLFLLLIFFICRLLFHCLSYIIDHPGNANSYLSSLLFFFISFVIFSSFVSFSPCVSVFPSSSILPGNAQPFSTFPALVFTFFTSLSYCHSYYSC